MRRPLRIDYTHAKAEGTCLGIPYNTELASIDGVTIHFWIGLRVGTEATELLDRCLREAHRHRDIVGATYSAGFPEGYWAHQNMGTDQ